MLVSRGLFLNILAIVLVQCYSISYDEKIKMDYEIRLMWNGEGLEESDVIRFSINENSERDGVEININAPFYDDPPPPNGEPGNQSFLLI